MGNPEGSLGGDWEGEEGGDADRRPAGREARGGGEGGHRLDPGRRRLGVPTLGFWELGGWLLTIGAEAAAALRGGGGAPVRGGLRLGCRSRPCGLASQDVDDL